MTYQAPIAEIAFTLKHIAGLDAAMKAGLAGDLTDDLLDAVLTEAGRFAADELEPLAKTGDTVGAKLKDGVVTMPPGWREAYKSWCDGGWNAIGGPVEFGGQNLPQSLQSAVLEMWNSAAMAFGLGPTLTFGAIDALHKHASDDLNRIWLEKLVSGEWMATMNLTEPQAGSDLALLKSRAERAGDGTYRIFGTKIFITYGEHDLTENIVHLVLARLPDAPAGTRGISLFLVPKFLVNADGSLGARNDVACIGLEHKIGIHASPTCVMSYGDTVHGDGSGAIGWLIGEEHRGLACMFTMMNSARLATGMQGVAIGEASHQKALAYARDRRQGRLVGSNDPSPSAIVAHPDVQRMLLTQKALTSAARAIAYCCGQAIDMSRWTTGDEAKAWSERAGLMTPIAKAFCSDIGVETASLGVQIHGGMGYIEETGAAVYWRDARIVPIYEGTNGIQAIDLVTRKIGLSGGVAVASLFAELRGDADRATSSASTDMAHIGKAASAAIDTAKTVTATLLDTLQRSPADALGVATPYLRLMALTIGGALLTRGALAGLATNDPAGQARVALARYFVDHLMVEVASLKAIVTSGSAAVERAAAYL
jgi:alkylation response protein AidB-like acyl-CoA dehydrogenase